MRFLLSLRFLVAVAVLASTLPVCSGDSLAAPAPRNQSLPPEAVSAYAAGEYDRSLDLVREWLAAQTEIDWREIRKHSRESTRHWPVPLASAFALELMTLTPPGQAPLVDWIEDFCERLRRQTVPSEFERAWLHASVALLERPRLDRPLAESSQSLAKHLDHGLRRFEDDPLLVMAGVRHAERNSYSGWKTVAEPRRAIRDIDLPGMVIRVGGNRHFLSALHDTREAAERAARIPPIRTEARAREAHTLVVLRRPSDALKLLAGADTNPTHDLRERRARYVTLILRAHVLGLEARFPEAGRDYALALALFPRAQSAAFPLAALLRASGRTGDADALVREVISKEPAADPWHEYFAGDYPLLARSISLMRERLP